jgi:hypothetical protein
MNPIKRWLRKRRWKREYVSLLAEVGNDPLLRVQNHVKRLDEYFTRWLGFCKLDSAASPQFLTDNALFLVLEAASTIAERDVNQLVLPEKEALSRAWREYFGSLLELQECKEAILTEAENSYLKLKTFADTFQRLRKLG